MDCDNYMMAAPASNGFDADFDALCNQMNALTPDPQQLLTQQYLAWQQAVQQQAMYMNADVPAFCSNVVPEHKFMTSCATF